MMEPARCQNQNCGAQNRDEPMASKPESEGAGKGDLSARLGGARMDLPRRLVDEAAREKAAREKAARMFQAAWRVHRRRGLRCFVCLENGDEAPLRHMGCACRNGNAMAHLKCLEEVAKGVDGNSCKYCTVCKQGFQGAAKTFLLGVRVKHTKELPVNHPHRIEALLDLACATSLCEGMDAAETFRHVLSLKRMIDNHPMAVVWVPDLYLTIATLLKRMGRHDQAIAQSNIGLDRLVSVEWPSGFDDHMRGAVRMSLLCAINHIEVENATEAFKEAEWVMHVLRPSASSDEPPIEWSSGTVPVHEAPLTVCVAQWMKALQTGDEAARRDAQASFAQEEATVRRVFGSSHIFTLKWIEWRHYLMSPRSWERE